MSQPHRYIRLTNFTQYAIHNTNDPYNPANLDQELNDVQTTTDDIMANLLLLQKDDGGIQNGIVTPESLNPTLQSMIPGSATASALYQPGDYYSSFRTSITGYYLCNGSLKSRSADAALFAVIGTFFGTGDGTTSFNLPNREAETAGVHYFIKY